MKTPISVVMIALAYWVVVYTAIMVPQLTSNYFLNLTWMTVVLPNVLRTIVGSVPQLAVDRVFFLSATVIALVLTYLVNIVFTGTREGIEEPDSDRSKKLKANFLLMGTFVAGALITYYVGIDNSIYSNMGWES
jgi:mannose/fructose/N-acetylgalactosamine-specific phosphotransferase system component IID